MSDDPNELTFLTSVRHELIEEIADLPVQNTNWQPLSDEKWAVIEGCLIFRGQSSSKIRTTLSREEVLELIDVAEEAGCPWITVPHTIREATARANKAQTILRPL